MNAKSQSSMIFSVTTGKTWKNIVRGNGDSNVFKNFKYTKKLPWSFSREWTRKKPCAVCRSFWGWMLPKNMKRSKWLYAFNWLLFVQSKFRIIQFHWVGSNFTGPGSMVWYLIGGHVGLYSYRGHKKKLIVL